MILYREIVTQKKAILEIASSHGAYNIRIFGSVIRSEETPDSDLDLLVEFEPGRSLIDHIGMMYDLQDFLNRKVDIVTEKGLNNHIKNQVIQEAVPL